MIVKILVNGKEFGVNVSENNYMGEVEVHDTFHCAAGEDGLDTIFGTNDSMITVIIGDDNMKYEPQCKHNCADCAGYETTGDCNHGCEDCSHFDGGNCINEESNYYGCTGGIPAADCHEWKDGE